MLDDFLGKVFEKFSRNDNFPSKILKILAVVSVMSVSLSFGQIFLKIFGSVWKVVGPFGRFFGPIDITIFVS